MAYRAGQKLGNYQLERLLGHGGFAEVYLGKHIYLHTQAAIKVLQRQLSDEALEKFLQEARIIASLKHPHIVRVLEFGIEEQHPFLVMAYAPHGTLRRCYTRGKMLPPRIIAPYVRQVADALRYAHERKIIHRDVKPENMLLDDDNTVLLSDFGLAMRERSTYHSVHSTDSAGTMIYMAPEQLRGKPCTASDQYALGVVMYEWLCGCLPFDGPDISVVVQHLHEPPVPLREHVPTLPPEVEAVVLRALEKEPKQRFASVQELAAAFEEACKDLPVPEEFAMIPLMDASGAEDSESGEWQQESLSSGLVDLLPGPVQEKVASDNRATPGLSWSSHYSSLQPLSLSATLNMTMSAQDNVTDATISTTLPQRRTRISRRTMIAGIVGIGAIAGGVGIWRLSSGGMGVLSRSVQGDQRSSGASPSSSTTTNRTSATTGTTGTRGSSGSLPASGNGAGKNGTTNSFPTGKSGGVTGASTPSPSSLSSGGNPALTSTPDTSGGSSGVTPTATNVAGAPQATALSVQMSVSSVIQQNSVVPISVITNLGNIAFDVTADFYYTDNSGNTQHTQHANINGNTTDSSGNATINWQSWFIPPGQLKKMKNPIVVFQAIATDTNGNPVYSQTATAQVQ